MAWWHSKSGSVGPGERADGAVTVHTLANIGRGATTWSNLLPRRQRGNIPGQLLALHVRRRAFAGMQQQAGAGGHAAEECSLALQPLSVSSQHESDWRLLSAAADQAKDCLGDAQVGLKGEWRQK